MAELDYMVVDVFTETALAGNPLAMRAGIAALGQLTKPGLYEEMTRLAERLVRGLRAESERAEIAAQINAIGSLATVFFTTGPVRNYADAKRSDTERYARFFREMLARAAGGTQGDLWLQVLQREISDRITVKVYPVGGGSPILKDVYIESIAHTI